MLVTMEVLPESVLWVIQFQPLSLKETPKSESGEGLTIYYHFTGWKFNLTLQTLRIAQKSQHSQVL